MKYYIPVAALILTIILLVVKEFVFAQTQVIVKFSGKAYATNFGFDHQASVEIQYPLNKRGKLVVTAAKDFQFEFKAKVGEDLFLRSCEECKVWFEVYREDDGKWVLIGQKTFSGGAEIKPKSDRIDVRQETPLKKYKLRAKARAKLSVLGEKGSGWKEVVFFVGLQPPKTSLLEAQEKVERMMITAGRIEAYQSLLKIAKSIANIDFNYSQCLFKLSLSLLGPKLTEIGTSSLKFSVGLIDYFDLSPDISTVIDKGASTSASTVETIITKKDLQSLLLDALDPTKDLKEVWGGLQSLGTVVRRADEICTAFDGHHLQFQGIQVTLYHLLEQVKKEYQELEALYFQQKKDTGMLKKILQEEQRLINKLLEKNNNHLISRISGLPYSMIKGNNKPGNYEFPDTAKMVRAMYKPFNYVFEDETIVKYFLTGEVGERRF